ncbi:MAG TPA: NUDIX domain-containing protein [bacterium]|nr:NUDIX domain-containing protein [bacterium]HQG45575.1 NUDIX domain-containing protein [bacterium]HQI47910.1 NUDIX domain-containing protein [bacterium]HQJ66326.1 NUDIX domain-containing protein [bacterium]
MAASDGKIMVVDRATLFAEQYFQGFAPASAHDYQSRILDHYVYDLRDKVEVMPEYKQPIAYAIIVHKESHEVFAYQRSAKEGHYNETRLRGKWSWGIGGHIDKIDIANGDPIRASLMRELSEEVEIKAFDDPLILGYINDDETEVGSVHFGMLYLILTSDRAVRPANTEIAWGGYMPIRQLEEIVRSGEAAVESWSEIALAPLKEVLARM